MCCIGALIFITLKSLHQEVVRLSNLFSSNHRVLYNTQTLNTTLHYTKLTPIHQQNLARRQNMESLLEIKSNGNGGGSGGSGGCSGGISVVLLHYYRIVLYVLYRSPHICYFKFSPSRSGKIYACSI